MHRILVISPGVLPVPPVLGGAVENLIARLHGVLCHDYEFHYVTVAAPASSETNDPRFDGAHFHTVASINPLEDFSFDNQYELQQSESWQSYADFCAATARYVRPDIVHVHNEAQIAIRLAQEVPSAAIILHVNDEVVTRLKAGELRQLSQSVDYLLSCSRYIYNQIEVTFASAELSPPRHDVFYNFVDLHEFDPDNVAVDAIESLRDRHGVGTAPVVMFVGRMIEQKGPHLLLQAMSWARRHGATAKLLFVGAPWYGRDSGSPWLDYLRSEVDRFSHDAIFTGYVAHHNIPTYYALADVVAAPSIWDDPSPFVAYEAQAMQRPIISSTRGGLPEIITDRETGRCIDVFNTPLFGDVLASWIRDPAERIRIGRRGRSRMSEMFSLPMAARRMDGIYCELTGQRDV